MLHNQIKFDAGVVATLPLVYTLDRYRIMCVPDGIGYGKGRAGYVTVMVLDFTWRGQSYRMLFSMPRETSPYVRLLRKMDATFEGLRRPWERAAELEGYTSIMSGGFDVWEAASSKKLSKPRRTSNQEQRQALYLYAHRIIRDVCTRKFSPLSLIPDPRYDHHLYEIAPDTYQLRWDTGALTLNLESSQYRVTCRDSDWSFHAGGEALGPSPHINLKLALHRLIEPAAVLTGRRHRDAVMYYLSHLDTVQLVVSRKTKLRTLFRMEPSRSNPNPFPSRGFASCY
jgi:hypothetical protein